MLLSVFALLNVRTTRSSFLRIREEITKPVGIYGWCSTLFTLACVAIIRLDETYLRHCVTVFSSCLRDP